MKRNFLQNVLYPPIKRLVVNVFRRVEDWVEADLPQFANSPRNLTIARPRRISSPHRIYIGDNVYLGPGSLLTAPLRYPVAPMLPKGQSVDFEQKFEGRITIGNRVTSTGRLTIGAHAGVTIEDDVMLAENILISDALHGYKNVDVPFKSQPLSRIAPIVIKRGCWIGQNVVIMPGVTIGEMSIIGANSVVTRSIPDHCIAIGAPAHVIKQWSEAAQVWINTVQDIASTVASLV